MTPRTASRCALLCAIFSGLTWGAPADCVRAAPLIAVTKADRELAPERDGLRAGDVVCAWAYNDSARGRRASGELRSIVDFSLMETEFGRRSGLALIVERDGKRLAIAVPARPWSFQVRPRLPPPDLPTHEQALRAMAESRWDEAASSFAMLAESRRRAAQVDDAVWYLEQAAAARRSQHRFDEAGRLTDRAVQLARETGKRALVAWTLQNAGEDLRLKGPSADARNRLTAALRIREALAPKSLATAQTLVSLQSLVRDANFDEAQRYASRALDIIHATAPGTLIEADAHQQLGSTLILIDDLEPALAHTREALRIRAQLDPGGTLEARSLGALGNIFRRRGDLDLAQQYYERALVTFRRAEPGGWLEAGTLRNLGALAADRRDLAAAERHQWAALAIYEKLAPEAIDVAGARNTLGLIYRRRGELSTARAFMEQALEQYRRLAPQGQSELVVLVNLAEVALEQHDTAGARLYLAASAAIIRAFRGRGFDLGTRLLEIGRTELGVGDLVNAEAHLTEALADMKRSGTSGLRVAEALTSLGQLHAAVGNANSARDDFTRAIDITSRLAPGTLLQAEPSYQLARLERASGRLQRADELFAHALAALDSQRTLIGGSNESRAQFSEKIAAYYLEYVDLLLGLGRVDDAFDISERYRARVLLEAFSQRELATAGLPDSLARDYERAAYLYERAFDRVRTFNAESERSGAFEQATHALEKARLERTVLENRVLALSSERPASALTQSRTAAQLRDRLAPETALLSYVATPKGLHVLVLSAADSAAGSRITAHRVLTNDVARLQEDIRAVTVQIRAHAATPDAQEALMARLASLHTTLIAPVTPLLRGKRQLVIVPDGALHRVPWAALAKSASRPRYLIEDYRIIVAPSATFHVEASGGEHARSQPIANVVALAGAARDSHGSDALPSAAAEVDMIKDIFGSSATVLSGAAATETASARAANACQDSTTVCFGASRTRAEPSRSTIRRRCGSGISAAPSMPTVSVSRKPTVVTSMHAFEAERTYAASTPLNRVLMGTMAAPAACAPKAAPIHPNPLGAQIATRSPDSTPATSMARLAVSTSSPSWRYVTRRSGSTTASASRRAAILADTADGIVSARAWGRCAVR